MEDSKSSMSKCLTCFILCAQILDCTAINNESTCITDSVYAPACCGIACTCIGKADLTVAFNGKRTVVLYHRVRCCAVLNLADGLAVKVKNNCLTCRNNKCVGKNNITKKNHIAAVSKCFCKGSILIFANLCNINNYIIVCSYSIVCKNSGAICCVVSLICGNNAFGTVNESIVFSNDGSVLNVKSFLVSIAEILEGVILDSDRVCSIGLDHTVSIIACSYGSTLNIEVTFIKPNCVLISSICIYCTVSKCAVTAETDTVFKDYAIKCTVNVVLIHELVCCGKVFTLISKSNILEGYALDVGNATANDGELSIRSYAFDYNVITKVHKTVRKAGSQLYRTCDLVSYKVMLVSECVSNSFVHSRHSDSECGHSCYGANINNEVNNFTNTVGAIFVVNNLVTGRNVCDRILVEGTTLNGKSSIGRKSMILTAGEVTALDGNGSTGLYFYSSATVHGSTLGANERTVLNCYVSSTGYVKSMTCAAGCINLKRTAIDSCCNSTVDTNAVAKGCNIYVFNNKRTCVDLDCAVRAVIVINSTVLYSERSGCAGSYVTVKSLAVKVKNDCRAVSKCNVLGYVSEKLDCLTISSCDSVCESCVAGSADFCNRLDSSDCTIFARSQSSTISKLNFKSRGCVGDGNVITLGNNDGALVADTGHIKLFNVNGDRAGCLIVISKSFFYAGVVEAVVLNRAVLKVRACTAIVSRGSLKSLTCFSNNRAANNYVTVVINVNTNVAVTHGGTEPELGVVAVGCHKAESLKSTAADKTRAGAIAL